MTTFQIKIIAILTMIIDHIGLFFFPDVFALRIIGRFSFPLFAWLIANGVYHTHNLKAYFLRLLLFAVLSQFPYLLANWQVNPEYSALNIFFTLSIGLGAIMLIKKTTMRIHWVLIAVVSAALAQYLQTDYGGFGVLIIISFYLFFSNWKKLVIAQSSILIAMSIYFLIIHNYLGLVEVVGICSLAIIYFYNKKEGRKMKYFFYLFYPLHYLVIYLFLRLV